MPIDTITGNKLDRVAKRAFSIISQQDQSKESFQRGFDDFKDI